MNSTRVWLPAIAAVAGSVMVGFMPLLARRLYAAGVDPASMLLWRYVIALPALLIAAAAIRLNLFVAWRRGAWKIALVGATLGVGQTITFWESIKTLDTSLEVCRGMIGSLTFDTVRMRAAIDRGYLVATELADYLVTKNVPFRDIPGSVRK